jgi:hypothetical protein
MAQTIELSSKNSLTESLLPTNKTAVEKVDEHSEFDFSIKDEIRYMKAEINYNDYYLKLLLEPFTMLLGPIYYILKTVYDVFKKGKSFE